MKKKKELSCICNKISNHGLSLIGLAGLFQKSTDQIPFDEQELYGIGELLRTIGEDIQELEDQARQEIF